MRGLRTVDHNDKDTDPGEYLKHSWTDDSRWQLRARLDPERGAVVNAAIDAITLREGCSATEALARSRRSASPHSPTRRTRRESYAVTNAPPSSSTSTPRGSAGAAGGPMRARRSAFS